MKTIKASNFRKITCATVAAASALLVSPMANASLVNPVGAEYDFTSLDSYATITTLGTGVYFENPTNILDSEVTGTGGFDPFLRVQKNGSQEGFNTSASGVLDNKNDPYTTDVNFGSLQVVNAADSPLGVDSYVFYLDVNQNANSNYVSLDELQIYKSSTGNVGSLATLQTKTLVWDLDAGSNGDSYLKLDYVAGGQGSGRGDIFFWIPISAFGTYSASDFIYIYINEGLQPGMDTNDGFDEVAGLCIGGDCRVIPEVNGILPLMGMLLFAFNTRMRKRSATV